MTINLPNSFPFGFPPDWTHRVRDNTLDNQQLETRCPLDNGRHDCTTIPPCFSTNQLDKLPVELLIEILLQLDIPSLTRFRCLSRRSMQLVNSVRQYAAIIKHCPNIIRAIISIQADAFDCDTLYRTLCTSRCSTCSRFGDHLYLIDCRRVCYLCFIRNPEYFPLTSYEAAKFFVPKKAPRSKYIGPRKLLELAKPPSILSLPGRYCPIQGCSRPKRIRLYDRRSVVGNLQGSGLPKMDKTTCEPKRFMAIITAPVLVNGGRQAEQGFFCAGCENDFTDAVIGKNFRFRYLAEELAEHFTLFGRVVQDPRYFWKFIHVPKDQITS